MNRLRREIKQCMSDLAESTEGQVKAHFIFPASFIGFQGHFPGKPILPGVCEIQAVMVLLEAWNRKKGRLREIVQAKFFATASCGEELVIKCHQIVGEREEVMVRAFVTSGDNKTAELKLKVSFEDEA